MINKHLCCSEILNFPAPASTASILLPSTQSLAAYPDDLLLWVVLSTLPEWEYDLNELLFCDSFNKLKSEVNQICKIRQLQKNHCGNHFLSPLD
ncbi:MAG: hypothetical protein KKC20_06750 [Proteobacteria bacterium]|nr:hypothetical protein [Pseudomonadota bacterium]